MALKIRANKYRDRSQGGSSKIPDRIDALCRCFFGKEFGDLPASHGIYYRLFSGVPGTLAEATWRGATHAALVVFEFWSSSLESKKLEANARTMQQFLALFGTPASASLDQLTRLQIHQPTEVMGDVPFTSVSAAEISTIFSQRRNRMKTKCWTTSLLLRNLSLHADDRLIPASVAALEQSIAS